MTRKTVEKKKARRRNCIPGLSLWLFIAVALTPGTAPGAPPREAPASLSTPQENSGEADAATGNASRRTAAVARKTGPAGSNGTKITHQVQTGDTLWRIANRHKVAISSIKSWNSLHVSSTIYPGQTLVIWKETGPVAVLTVKNRGKGKINGLPIRGPPGSKQKRIKEA